MLTIANFVDFLIPTTSTQPPPPPTEEVVSSQTEQSKNQGLRPTNFIIPHIIVLELVVGAMSVLTSGLPKQQRDDGEQVENIIREESNQNHRLEGG